MNLIEAWKKAKEGQVIRENHLCIVRDSVYLGDVITNSGWLTEDALLSDNWELEPTKHKEVYEDCIAYESCIVNTYFSISCEKHKNITSVQLPLDKKFKLTIEWEE